LPDHGVVAGAERQPARNRRVADPGNRSQRLEQLSIERRPFVARVFRRGQRELKRHQTIGLKAERHALELEQSLAEQSGADEPHGRQGELCRGQTAAHPRARPAGPARALLQHRVQIGLRSVARRRNAKQDAGDHGDAHGEQQDRRIDADVRNRQEVWRQCAVDRTHGPDGAEHPEAAAEHRQDDALREQLPQQARLARAHCRANRDLPLARRGASEEQVGDVRARDEQHAADGAEQHEQADAQLRAHEGIGHGDVFSWRPEDAHVRRYETVSNVRSRR
jgi:hypothetical protein